MKQWMVLSVVWIVVVTSACRGSTVAVPEAEKAAVRDHAAQHLREARREALANASTCAIETPVPRIVLQFRGLVDLASRTPDATGSAKQDSASVALVNAEQPGRLPVRGKDEIAVHQPWLIFADTLNGELGEEIGDTGFRRISLKAVRVEIADAGDPAPVTMHRESRGLNHRRPVPANRCSLNWLALADDLAPGTRLRSGVFTAGASDLVTTLFSIGEGEMYTGGFHRKGSRPTEECVVRFPSAREEAALARSFSIAIPVAMGGRKLVLSVTRGGATTEWVFELPAGVPQDVLFVHNLPVDMGRRDFAAHFALREGMDGISARIPLPEYTDCARPEFFNDNPQCSPVDNQFP